MIDLERGQRRPAPYPLLELDDALSAKDFSALRAEFPTDAEAAGFERVMGGRQRLASDELAFHGFLRERPAWRRLYERVNSADFVQQVLRVFAEELQLRACDLVQPVQFDADYMLRIARHRANMRGVIPRVLRRFGVRRQPEHPVLPGKGDRVFVHFDISSAENGYRREIHRDMDNRIAAFLIYFSSAAECGGEGGEFGIHGLRSDAAHDYPDRQPDAAHTELHELVRPRENLLMMFLSTPDSYHSVPEIRDAVATRRFIYVGISTDRDLRWAWPPDAERVA